MKKSVRNKTAVPCPTRELLDCIGNKWSMLTITTLAKSVDAKCRFSQLQKKIEGISQRMLTVTLRNLERDGYVIRHFYPEIPPRVEYELTVIGRGVFTIVQELKIWVEKHWEKIYAARVVFDAKKGS